MEAWKRKARHSLPSVFGRAEWQDVWVASTVGTQLAGADVTCRMGNSAVVTVSGGGVGDKGHC